DDTALRVLDTRDSNAAPLTLGPASATAVFNGKAAFLRPEAAGAPGRPGGVDLNADGDTTDEVVHLWAGTGAPLNLGRAATAGAVPDRCPAARVAGAGQGHTDLNGDGDAADAVVEIAPLTATTGADWVNLRQAADSQAADSLDVAGGVVAFITPESAQGSQD